MKVSEAQDSGLLIDGRTYFKAFYQAAKNARRYILISGWQFDSDTELIRGKDRKQDEEYGFLAFLNSICAKNPSLQIYILAWDFSLLFTLEREWFQKFIFNWTSCSKIHFRFDSSGPIGSSQHQKFVVIDGKIAFLGGADICANRWDDRKHSAFNPHRTEPGDDYYGPYHEIQAYLTGPVVKELEAIFKRRWSALENEDLVLEPDIPVYKALTFKPSISIGPAQCAISRTVPRTQPLDQPVYEIKNLYMDLIAAARELIYMENQYFTSRAVYSALVRRMEEKPQLVVIIILPPRPEAFLEEFGLSETQSELLCSLKEIAGEKGHQLGIFYSSARKGPKEIPTYIHSKFFIVDDRFMTVGSANTTNRSLGMDTEVNVSWEAPDGELREEIRHARVSLLCEHTGSWEMEARKAFRSADGLARYLSSISRKKECKLQEFSFETIFDNYKFLKALKPDFPIFDPDKPIIEENIYEFLSRNSNSFFAKGITILNGFLKKNKDA